jgi:putative membrane protein
MREPPPDRLLIWLLLVTGTAVFVWSAIHPKDLFTWILEVLPVIIGVTVLASIRNRLRFTPLVYVLVWIHAIILMVGGHYTYADVPLFDWIKDALHLARNHYDRLGHFFQGFEPAILAREVLLRKTPLKRGNWLQLIVVCVCLAISASYELVEWGVAVATGTAANAFLGTQGDVWDTQWDMAMCLIGAVAALALLTRLHDRQLRQFKGAWK